MASRTFEQSRSSVPAARKFVTDLLADLPADLAGTAALLVSELAANAVLYGAGPFEVSVQRFTGQLCARIGVTDAAGGNPVPQKPADTAEHGRGLQLVSALSHAWGVDRGAAGKTVWFELPAPSVRTAGSAGALAGADGGPHPRADGAPNRRRGALWRCLVPRRRGTRQETGATERAG